jgi:hypothetical protein
VHKLVYKSDWIIEMHGATIKVNVWGFTYTILCTGAYETFSTADAGRTEFCGVFSNDYWTSVTVCSLIRRFLDRGFVIRGPSSFKLPYLTVNLTAMWYIFPVMSSEFTLQNCYLFCMTLHLTFFQPYMVSCFFKYGILKRSAYLSPWEKYFQEIFQQ